MSSVIKADEQDFNSDVASRLFVSWAWVFPYAHAAGAEQRSDVIDTRSICRSDPLPKCPEWQTLDVHSQESRKGQPVPRPLMTDHLSLVSRHLSVEWSTPTATPAVCHSRVTVARESDSSTATSSSVRPPK